VRLSDLLYGAVSALVKKQVFGYDLNATGIKKVGCFVKKNVRFLNDEKRKKIRFFNFHSPLSRYLLVKLVPLFRHFNIALVDPIPASRLSYKTEGRLVNTVFSNYPYKMWGSRVGGVAGLEATRHFNLIGNISSNDCQFNVITINRKAGIKLASLKNSVLASITQSLGWLNYSKNFTSFLHLICEILPSFSGLISPLSLQINTKLTTFKSLVFMLKKGKRSFRECDVTLTRLKTGLAYSLLGWISWWRGVTSWAGLNNVQGCL
jgi:hypothetical protein